MKSKLSQLVAVASKIDPRHLQMAYLFFMLVVVPIVLKAPSDGGTGPT